MTEQEWLGNNQLSLDIWSKKYRKDESFEQWLDRVSGNNSDIKRLIRENYQFYENSIKPTQAHNLCGNDVRNLTYRPCVTLVTYLQQVRITHAKRMLRFTDKSIEEIGLECGIGELNYFSRVFKKLECASPSEYRRMW